MNKKLNEIKKMLETRMPDKLINIVDIPKNNGVVKHGVSIKAVDSQIAPILYVDDLNLSSVEKICDSLIESYNECSEDDYNCRWMDNYDEVRPMLNLRLLNERDNRNMLSNVLHKSFLDLAVIVVIDLDIGVIKITDSLLDIWGRDFEEIYRDALNNFEHEDTYIQKLSEVMKKIDPNLDFDYVGGADEADLFILSNKDISFGAVRILDNVALDLFASKFGCDILILPSSIHEFLIRPLYEEIADIDEVNEVVKYINDTVLHPEDVLSDHLYIYRIKTKTIVSV